MGSPQKWTVASLGSGAVALVGLLLSFTTTHWLYMEETCKMSEKFMNLTVEVNFTMFSNAGLWRICSRHGNAEFTDCVESGLNYGLEKQKGDRDDSQWRTGTVTEATRIQFPLTCIAVLLTASGFICSILGNFRRDRKTVIAAVLYISSGLCLSVGVILFISRINDELSYDSADCFAFKYSYGWSFYLIGLSFVVEEISAVISIKLYLMSSLNSVGDMIRTIPGLEDKLFIDTGGGNNLASNIHTLIW
ncbi:regulation of AMPA receptor [Mactra antiquata]